MLLQHRIRQADSLPACLKARCRCICNIFLLDRRISCCRHVFDTLLITGLITVQRRIARPFLQIFRCQLDQTDHRRMIRHCKRCQKLRRILKSRELIKRHNRDIDLFRCQHSFPIQNRNRQLTGKLLRDRCQISDMECQIQISKMQLLTCLQCLDPAHKILHQLTVRNDF